MKYLKKLNLGGFTLVELMVTIVVGGIFAGSANLIIVQHTRESLLSRNLVVANSFVEGKFEELRSIGFAGLTNGITSLTDELPNELTNPKSASLEISNYDVSIKKVDVTITYSNQGTPLSYTYTSYLGELGVGQN